MLRFFNRILLRDNFVHQCWTSKNLEEDLDLVYSEYFCCVYVDVVEIINKMTSVLTIEEQNRLLGNIEAGSKPADKAETFGVTKRRFIDLLKRVKNM